MKARGWIATSVVGLASVLAAGVLLHSVARSADHLDSPATKADSTIDINDVFSWVEGSNVILAMTVYPAAPKTALFSDTAQYVIHTSNGAGYPVAAAEYNVICTFKGTTAPQTAECWGGNNEYATGPADSASGIVSKDGKFKVFAGVRADPFFFNLDGFKNAVSTVETVAPTLVFNDAGCPTLTAPQSALLVGQLSHAPDGGAPNDFFKTFNALAIVVQVDKTLVNNNGPILAVWASTHK